MLSPGVFVATREIPSLSEGINSAASDSVMSPSVQLDSSSATLQRANPFFFALYGLGETAGTDLELLKCFLRLHFQVGDGSSTITAVSPMTFFQKCGRFSDTYSLNYQAKKP